jgi:hypothetical protein
MLQHGLEGSQRFDVEADHVVMTDFVASR